jgi:capsular exopolysaccharide synthesis family protein
MSRIQNILDKAERDGAMRRVRPLAEASAIGATATALADNAPGFAVTDVVEAAVVAEPLPVPARVISGVHLHPTLVAAAEDGSIAAEQYRAMRTRLLHAETGAAVNIVLVTSPGRGDGKTLTVANLGLTMAQEPQRRICVMDADLREPQQHFLFGVPSTPGLADVLAGAATLDDALVTLEDYQITILPAGIASAHPAELLGTMAMRRTLDALRSRFDCVVIDAPAALPLADVGILTPLVDSVVMVVRAGLTSKPAIHDAVAAIDGGKLIGIVLNDAAA